MLPSGILRDNCLNLIGNGVTLHIPKLLEEIDNLKSNGIDASKRLFISDRVHLLFRFHQIIDGINEVSLGSNQIGTTKRGIGPCYASKMIRNGLRAGDLKHFSSFEIKLRRLCSDLQKQYSFEYDIDTEIELYRDYAKIIVPLLVDGVQWIHDKILSGKRALFEGANAVMLDIDFGTYPFVTSSSPGVGGACIGLGVPPKLIGNAYGVVKAYCTRVGSGPFPTELHGELDDLIRNAGHEYGTTTGRPRRCGWLDIVQVRYANLLNGFDAFCLTKLDCLSVLDEIKLGVKYFVNGKEIFHMPANLEELSQVEVYYETFKGFKGYNISKIRNFEDLPEEAKKYVLRIEELLQVPIKWIGVGPDSEDLIIRNLE